MKGKDRPEWNRVTDQQADRSIFERLYNYTRYACGPDSPSPDWARLVDRDQLIAYFEKLKRARVGPEGRLAKLDYFHAAMRFMTLHVLAEETHPLYQKFTKAMSMLDGWKKTLRKEKRRLRKVRLQKLSCESLSLDEITALLDSQKLWAHFNATCLEAERDQPVAASCLDQAAVVLAASLLYKNWQRPGALVNATVKEFEDCKVMEKGGIYIMSVENHKTAVEGVAKVVLDGVDHGRVIQYLETVRRRQVGDKEVENLFVLSGGRPIVNLSSKIKAIGLRYGLSLPSATRVRKIGATSVALNLGKSASANLVTRQMSHSVNTEAIYYQAIVGDKHAASAYSTMSNLRTGQQTTPVTEKEESTLRSTQQRRPYSDEETEAIKRYFVVEIGAGDRVALAACKKFLGLHHFSRTAKNVQDKIRNLVHAEIKALNSTTSS